MFLSKRARHLVFLTSHACLVSYGKSLIKLLPMSTTVELLCIVSGFFFVAFYEAFKLVILSIAKTPKPLLKGT